MLSAKDITNLFLYGQRLTPIDLSDDKLIRPISAEGSVDINLQEFMKNGAGRFAIGSQFEIIQKFFESDVPPRDIAYTKQEIANIFGLDFFGWDMQQWNYRDGTDDYAERVYIFNSQAYRISDDARFVVNSSGEKSIINFAIEPITNIQENFDFESTDFIATIGNDYLERRVDPSGIGRIVNINYIGESIPRITYRKSDFDADVIKRNSFQGLDLFKLKADIDSLLTNLFDTGVTRFVEGNKPILYGTTNADVLNGGDLTQKGYHFPTFVPYRANGAILIGGDGNDTLTGTTVADELWGGNGNDSLNSGWGNDYLIGGDGDDSLNDDFGDDYFIGGSGNDTINGGSFVFGLFGGTDKASYSGSSSEYDIEYLPNKSVRISDKVADRDGIDTLTGIEYAVFSDKSIKDQGLNNLQN
jgi:Ca2+-binding RTX toxin-like protein